MQEKTDVGHSEEGVSKKHALRAQKDGCLQLIKNCEIAGHNRLARGLLVFKKELY